MRLPSPSRKKKLPRRILGTEDADRFEIAEGEIIRQLFPQRLRQIAHLLERRGRFHKASRRSVSPGRALAQGGQMSFDLFEKQRMDQAFGVRLHQRR